MSNNNYWPLERDLWGGEKRVYNAVLHDDAGTEVFVHSDAIAYKRGDSVMIVSYIPGLNQNFGAFMPFDIYKELIEEAKKVKVPMGVFAWAYRWGKSLNERDSESIAYYFCWYCEEKSNKSFGERLPHTTDIVYMLSTYKITEERGRRRDICEDIIRGVCSSWDALMSIVANTPRDGRWQDGIRREYRNFKVNATVLNIANDITMKVR